MIIVRNALLLFVLILAPTAIIAQTESKIYRDIKTIRVPIDKPAKAMFAHFADLNISPGSVNTVARCSYQVSNGAQTISLQEARSAISSAPRIIIEHLAELGPQQMYEIARGVGELAKRIALFELVADAQE